jgi:HEAT repeat protein
VYAKLGQLLVVDANEVRIAAAKGLGTVTENRKKASIYLANGLAPNQKEPMVVAAILEALGKVKESPAPESVVKYLKTRNTPICKAAVQAAAEIGSRATVPALVDCLKWLEENAKDAPATGGGGGGYAGLGGGGTVADQESKDRERAVKPICLKALQDITKSSNSNAKEWESWLKSAEGARFLRGEK